ncbi:MAG: hypothetical protein Q7R96_01615 [Nanoarchaeota archaeon]|nr:hypothetical protein [Nanoarchaeota archaeon]
MRFGTLVLLGLTGVGAYYFMKSPDPTVRRLRETTYETVPRSCDRVLQSLKSSADDVYGTYQRLRLEEKIRAREGHKYDKK